MKYKKRKEILDNQLYLWNGEYLNIISNNQSEIISPKSIFSKLYIILKEIIKDFINLFKNNRVHYNEFAFVETGNNVESLSFLDDDFPFISPKKMKDLKSDINIDIIHARYKLLYDISFIPYIIWLFYTYKKERSKIFKRIDILFKAYGLVDEYVRILSINKPSKIIFTNDHNIYSRGMLIAAKLLEVKTIYIQHASVSKYFPPLIFDLSLLEGEDAELKYKSISDTTSKIILVGMPKFDRYSNEINSSNAVKSIGLCYNLNDSITDVIDIANKIKIDFPKIKIGLRGHPNDHRLTYCDDFSISQSREENSFAFLSTVDMIITGDSSIHVEAIMMNVVSSYHNFSRNIKMNDYYDFVRHGLIDKLTSYSEIKLKIQEETKLKSNVQYKAKYYNEAINSTFYGRSSQRVINCIKSIT